MKVSLNKKGRLEVETPLISIVTITYNAEKELPATMRSVAEQTFKDFEHIIIDGASKDNTIAIARDLGNKNGEESLRIYSEPDKGLYDAMNKGLRKAKGKYILYLNAGDAFHDNDALEAYGEAAKADPDIIYADTVIVDEKRNLIGPRHLSVPDKLSYKSFSKGMLVCHQAFMAKRALAPEYDLSYRFSADYDWTLKCLKKTEPSKCINLKRVAIDYLSNGTTDKNKLKSLRERFHIMSRNYGLLSTIGNHISFIFRALKRKYIK